MEIVTDLAERLGELLFYRKLTVEDFCKITGISKTSVYDWLLAKNKYYPSLSNTIKVADYFKCSVDFLIGIEKENYNPNPKQCPPFSERFKIAVKSRGFSLNKLSKAINMGSGNFYRWIRGEREPSLDSLVRIAKALDCTVDYLLGRGD